MDTSTQKIHLHAIIPEDAEQKRLDQALAQLFPDHSRSRLKQWIDSGLVKINGKNLRPKDRVLGGETIEIHAEITSSNLALPEAIPLDIVYEDQDILVINKPANLVVHPGSGNKEGTLLNALLHHCPCLGQLPRAGIVHRLDKDTTGLLIVAKTLMAHTSLVKQLQERTLSREYEALVWGVMISGGTLSAPMARHPKDRKKMAVVEHGKPAITHYRVIKRFKSHTHLLVQLETGRTHQIRVHMAHLHYPILGDKTYGGRLRIPPTSSKTLLNLLRTFPRQALHARRLGLIHPRSGEKKVFEAPLPLDIQQLIEGLSH